MRLARSSTTIDPDDGTAGEAAEPTRPDVPSPAPKAPTGRAAELVALLGLHKLHQPSRTNVEIDGVRVDLAFDHRHAVVMFDPEPGSRRDDTTLLFAGWHVVHIGPDDSLEAAIRANPSAFGRMS